MPPNVFRWPNRPAPTPLAPTTPGSATPAAPAPIPTLTVPLTQLNPTPVDQEPLPATTTPSYFPTSTTASADVAYTAPPPSGGPSVPYGYPTMAPETPDQMPAPAPAGGPSWIWWVGGLFAAWAVFAHHRVSRLKR